MALSLFSLNPSTFPSSSSSHSLHFLLLQRQTHFSKTSKPLKFRISSSQRVVQVASEQQPQRVKLALETTKQTKKKRKPKPSFFEQIQEKWSAKIGSTREKFPWQEESLQDEQEGDNEEEERETEIDVKESVSDSVSFGGINGVVSAPWAHGTKPFKPHVVSEPETPENSDNGDFQREFDVGRDEISEEEREISNNVMNDFSLDDGEESSDYESNDLPWKKAGKAESKEGEKAAAKRRSNTAMAEKTLPEHELKRLRNVSLRMLERTKVGARGITQALVDSIHEKWKLDEVVKLKFEEPLSLNMRRTHEILEVSFGSMVAL